MRSAGQGERQQGSLAGTGTGQGPAGSRLIPASVAKDATPGGEVQKEAAGRPWVFNVDTMLQDFLQGPKPEGKAGGRGGEAAGGRGGD